MERISENRNEALRAGWKGLNGSAFLGEREPRVLEIYVKKVEIWGRIKYNGENVFSLEYMIKNER